MFFTASLLPREGGSGGSGNFSAEEKTKKKKRERKQKRETKNAKKKRKKEKREEEKYTVNPNERIGARSIGMENTPPLPLDRRGERYPRKPEMIPVAIALKFEETIFYPLSIDGNRGNEFSCTDLRRG